MGTRLGDYAGEEKLEGSYQREPSTTASRYTNIQLLHLPLGEFEGGQNSLHEPCQGRREKREGGRDEGALLEYHKPSFGVPNGG